VPVGLFVFIPTLLCVSDSNSYPFFIKSVEDKNSDEIQLSAAKVTMGECKFSSEKGNGMAGEISIEWEDSYIPAFLRMIMKDT
jgi:hypothetical protein